MDWEIFLSTLMAFALLACIGVCGYFVITFAFWSIDWVSARVGTNWAIGLGGIYAALALAIFFGAVAADA